LTKSRWLHARPAHAPGCLFGTGIFERRCRLRDAFAFPSFERGTVTNAQRQHAADSIRQGAQK
ncbi:MAG TPA: hypothetical protein VFE67_16950, partial [Rudaea sp.]|nr:hypothetical protein [Rudaea sp.]